MQLAYVLQWSTIHYHLIKNQNMKLFMTCYERYYVILLVEGRADQMRGWRSQRFRMGYGEPTWAQSRQET